MRTRSGPLLDPEKPASPLLCPLLMARRLDFEKKPRRALAKQDLVRYNGSAFAGVMELADVLDSKSSGGDTVRVRPPPPASCSDVSMENMLASTIFETDPCSFGGYSHFCTTFPQC